MFPQLLLLGLYMMSLGISLSKHGEDKTGKHSIWIDFVSVVISLGILYWGGFFDVLFK